MRLTMKLLIVGLVARSTEKGIFASAHTIQEDPEAKGFRAAEVRCRPQSLTDLQVFDGCGIYEVGFVITTFRGDTSIMILAIDKKVKAVDIAGALPSGSVGTTPAGGR